jgi:hypothetical protein
MKQASKDASEQGALDGPGPVDPTTIMSASTASAAAMISSSM